MAMSKVQNVPVTKTMTIRIRTVMFTMSPMTIMMPCLTYLRTPLKGVSLNVFLSEWNRVQMMHKYRKDYDENDHTCPSNARATVDNHGRSQGVAQPGGRHHSYHLGLVKIISTLIGEGDLIYGQ